MKLPASTDFTKHTPSDAVELANEGKAACGQAALAAALGWSVAQVLPLFEKQGTGLWVSEKRMEMAIALTGSVFIRNAGWPNSMTVLLIQGLGSWMKPGLPIGARNSRTHWVATVCDDEAHQWVYDINIGDWLPRAMWETNALKPILEHWKTTSWQIRQGYIIKPTI